MTERADPITERYLGGESCDAHAIRYDDNDVVIQGTNAQGHSGSFSVESSIALSWNQLHEFTTVIQEESAPHDIDRVENVEVEKEWILGPDQRELEAVCERTGESLFEFSLGDNHDSCLLSLSQAQQLYEFLVTNGYDDMWGTKP